MIPGGEVEAYEAVIRVTESLKGQSQHHVLSPSPSGSQAPHAGMGLTLPT